MKSSVAVSTARPERRCSSGSRRSTRRTVAMPQLSSGGQSTTASSGTASRSTQPVRAAESSRVMSSGRAGAPTISPQMAAIATDDERDDR